MPRQPRMYLPGVPFHVIQRGNNRGNCFFSDSDYKTYLDCLIDASRRYGLDVHAYVLMTNHVHLLVSPEREDSISRAMQSIGRRFVQHINRSYGRTGTLWEGRHRASPVDQDKYLFTCMRYIELNPVRANMVQTAGEYHWSSYLCNAHNVPSLLIRRHSLFEALGLDEESRVNAYRALFDKLPSNDDLSLIRRSVQLSMPTGDDHFHRQIEQALGRAVGRSRRGRRNRIHELKCE